MEFQVDRWPEGHPIGQHPTITVIGRPSRREAESDIE